MVFINRLTVASSDELPANKSRKEKTLSLTQPIMGCRISSSMCTYMYTSLRLIDAHDLWFADHSRTWLRALHQGCLTLRKVTLDFRLAASGIELDMLLLSAPLQEIRLGLLLRDTINDWTIAIALAQPSLRVLELTTRITQRSLQILHS